MEVRPHHWSCALGAALLAHVGLLALIRAPEPSNAVGAGLDRIEIAFGAKPDAPGAAPALAALAEAEAIAAEEIAPASAPDIVSADAVPVETAAAIAPQTAPPLPIPSLVEAVATGERAEVRVAPSAEAPPDREGADPVAGPEVAKTTEPEAALEPADGARIGASGQADYFNRILAWLEQNKRYPRRARLRGEQGVVVVRFVVARGGTVSELGIEKSSGYPALDEAARKLLLRAAPLPDIPSGMRGDSFRLRIPISFSLQ